MRVAIVTDAWHPQVNGVVKTLSTTASQLQTMGHDVLVVEPSLFNTFPCPTYPEIRLAWLPSQQINALLGGFKPDAIHIATEGTLGSAARRWCLRSRFPFTTSYHTQFPEYIRARMPIPLAATYAYLRNFHGAAARTMVATPTMQKQLEQRGFKNIARWSRGVDLELFKPQRIDFLPFPRPIWIYVGRVAVEKNIEEFLSMPAPGTKVVGYKFGAELAAHVASADVFVFPSRTDTFGLVLLEAMACGVPVAAYSVTGPIDVVAQGVSGAMNEDLGAAARAALLLDPENCRAHALQYSWEAATEQFLTNLQPANSSSKLVREPTLVQQS
jgi:glycosyltransferase involved in cell wall biosynthesis